MNEDFLHYIWQFKLFDHTHLQTTDGEPLQIVQYGQHNHDSGPDFSNARIKIGDTTLAGQIEIHVKSIDWLLHQHQQDAAYQNVILHVVYEHDVQERDNKRIGKPTLELKQRVPSHLWERYHHWLHSKREIPCDKALAGIKPISIRFWFERLFVERLSEKIERIDTWLDENGNDKEQAAYRLLLRYFGGTVNAAAFERLSQLLPYKILIKHRNQPVVMEALLFGVAGFLNAEADDMYIKTLQEHFSFYQTKYQLTHMNAAEWKLMRMRPVSFPGHRLAQFAALLQQAYPLYSRLTAITSAKAFYQLLQVEVSSYWKTHYHFGKASDHVIEKPGMAFSDNLCINAVIPLMYFEGRWAGKEELKEQSLTLAGEIASENNKITRLYRSLGIRAENALESQAMLKLYHHYCVPKKCLSCAFGHDILNE